MKDHQVFSSFIKSIKCIPSFQLFGLSQYYIYIYPTDLNEVDFTHFLHNSFQSIKYPTKVGNSNSFLIKYIWPYQTPNTSRLNWLVKSKKVIREYCLYFIKRVIPILHFDRSITPRGWNLDHKEFRKYFETILFKSEHTRPSPLVKPFNIGALHTSSYYAPDSEEYQLLTKYYSYSSTDLKTHIWARSETKSQQIINLLRKNLIFPYFSLRNLGFVHKLYFILPALRPDIQDKITQVFSFFNYGFIYEIEGEYYISGFPKEEKFECGLMMKIYLQDCQIEEFYKLFVLILKYFKIKHYIILSDMADGKDLLKSMYGNLDFLKKYNPLKNLIWNKIDKIWMNDKLFNKKFEKLYPPMIPESK